MDPGLTMGPASDQGFAIDADGNVVGGVETLDAFNTNGWCASTCRENRAGSCPAGKILPATIVPY